MIDVHRNICDYRDYGYGILLEYWILLWIGYPLWLLRVGGSGLDNHFQPCLLSLSLSTLIMGHQSVYLLHFVMIIGCLQGNSDISKTFNESLNTINKFIHIS